MLMILFYSISIIIFTWKLSASFEKRRHKRLSNTNYLKILLLRDRRKKTRVFAPFDSLNGTVKRNRKNGTVKRNRKMKENCMHYQNIPLKIKMCNLKRLNDSNQSQNKGIIMNKKCSVVNWNCQPWKACMLTRYTIDCPQKNVSFLE